MRGIVSPVRMGLKTITVTYQAATETAQGVPVGLPAAQPGAAQVTWTVAAGDLPTESSNFRSRVHIGFVCIGGKNTDTVSRAVSFRIYKNGSSVQLNAKTVEAGYYWTAFIFCYNIAAGDVFTVYMWAAVANKCDWRYDAHQVQLTRPVVSLPEEILAPVIYESISLQPTLSGGPNPAPDADSNHYLSWKTNGADIQTVAPTGSIQVQALVPPDAAGLLQLRNGDQANPNVWAADSDATRCPYYHRNRLPLALSWRNWGRLAP